jgi:endonuclease/exonuclease/phosphatase family protein
MAFSVLSWNIEHFKGGAARLARAAAHIRQQDPDVLGLLEIEGADVKSLIEGNFPGYDFAITDGPEVQEILIGWRRNALAKVSSALKLG